MTFEQYIDQFTKYTRDEKEAARLLLVTGTCPVIHHNAARVMVNSFILAGGRKPSC